MSNFIIEENLPKNVMEQQLIRHVFLGQESLAAAYALLLDHEKSESILSSIIFSSAPKIFTPNNTCENYTKVRWKAFIAASILNPTIELPQDFYHSIIKSLKYTWAHELYEILSTFDPADIVSQNAIKILAHVYNQNQQVYTSVIPTVDFILNNVQAKELFRKMGFDTFAMKPYLTEQTVQAFDVSKLNNSNLSSFFNNFFLLKIQNVQSVLQKLVYFSEPSLHKSELFNQGSHFQITNTCIVKKSHLIDLVLQQPLNLLNSGNFNAYCESMKKYPDLIGYVFMCFYEVYKDSEDFIPNLRKLTGFNSPCDIINRIVNDYVITDFVNSSTGLEMIPTDFQISSFAQILFPSINKLDVREIEDISQRRYFNITDLDRNADFAFLLGYLVIYNVLEFIKYQKPLQIGELLTMIEDEEKRKNIVVDVFSLIFLQKDNKYVCDIAMAESILLCISGFMSDEKFMRSATGRFLFSKIVGSQNLESALVSTQDGVLQMLNMNEPDIAMNMSANLPILFDIVMCVVCEKSDFYEKPDIFYVEKFLTTNINQKVNLKSDKPHVKELIEKRKQNKNPLDIIGREQIDQGLDSFKYIGFICMNFGGYFSDFMRYRYAYSRLMRRAKIQKKGRMRIPELVQIIVETAFITEEESLRILLGNNSYEQILMHENLYEVNEYVYSLIKKKCEPAAYALLVNNPNIAKIEGNSPLNNLFNQKEIDPDFAAMSDFDFYNQFKTTKPIDYDLMDDLYYRRSDLFEKEVMNNLSKFSPFDLIQFLPFANRKSLVGLQKLGITSMNATNIFEYLLSLSNHYLLNIFINDFNLQNQFLKFFTKYLPSNVNNVFKKSAQLLYSYLYKMPDQTKNQIENKIIEIQKNWFENDNIEKVAKINEDNEKLLNWYMKERRKYGQQITALRTYIFKSKDHEMIRNLTEEFFKTYEIDNSEDEYEIFLLLRELRVLQDAKFNALLRFVGKFVNSRYDINYRLSDHKNLIDICFKVDDLDTLDELCNAYSVSFTPYGEEFSVICAKLSLSRQSMGLLQRQSKSKEFGDKIIRTMMSKMQLTVPKGIDDLEDFKKIYRNIKIPSYSRVNPVITHVSDVLLQLQIFDSACTFCIQNLKFDQAFDIFCIAEGDGKFFFDNILIPAISTSQVAWAVLWQKYSQRKILSEENFDKLIDRIEKSNCYKMLTDIFKSLDMSTKLVSVLTSSLQNSTSWDEMEFYIDELIKALDNVVKANNSLVEKKKYVFLKNRCENQKVIIDVCRRREISFSPSISIVDSSDDAMAVCTMLMRLCEITIVLDILPDLASFFTFEEVCERLVNSLIKSGEGSLQRWMKTLSRKVQGFEYDLCVGILVSLVFEKQTQSPEENMKYITSFIKENVLGDSARCKSFCKVGNIEEAFAAAKTPNQALSIELYTEVRDAANKFGFKQIANKCNKLLK